MPKASDFLLPVNYLFMKNMLSAMGKPNTVSRIFKTIRTRISGIFAPQEVEVTFKTDGKKVRYTYTKVSEQKVA